MMPWRLILQRAVFLPFFQAFVESSVPVRVSAVEMNPDWMLSLLLL